MWAELTCAGYTFYPRCLGWVGLILGLIGVLAGIIMAYVGREAIFTLFMVLAFATLS